jgi:hypothetical protein
LSERRLQANGWGYESVVSIFEVKPKLGSEAE